MTNLRHRGMQLHGGEVSAKDVFIDKLTPSAPLTSNFLCTSRLPLSYIFLILLTLSDHVPSIASLSSLCLLCESPTSFEVEPRPHPLAPDMINSTVITELPPLPTYTLKPLPPLVHPIPDKYLSLVLPVVAYWVVSLIFHWIDVNDYFPQYRLHTPEEVLKRNHVSRWEVFRDVIVQQIIQTAFGAFLGVFDPDPEYGREDYDIAIWAQRTRVAQRLIPVLLSALGVDSRGLAQKLGSSSPMAAGALNGGEYPWLMQVISMDNTSRLAPAFAPWELMVARAFYWFIVPAFQFGFAILVVDTWQYFWHRAMHMNRWLYGAFNFLFF